jgi:hypothetical protein
MWFRRTRIEEGHEAHGCVLRHALSCANIAHRWLLRRICPRLERQVSASSARLDVGRYAANAEDRNLLAGGHRRSEPA